MNKTLLITTLALASLTLAACSPSKQSEQTATTTTQSEQPTKVTLSSFLKRGFENKQPLIFYKTFDAKDEDTKPEYAIVFQEDKATYYNLDTSAGLTMAELSAMTTSEQLANLEEINHIAYLSQLNDTKQQLIDVLDQYDLAVAEARDARELEKGVSINRKKNYEVGSSDSRQSTLNQGDEKDGGSIPKVDIAIETYGVDLHYLEIPYDLTIDQEAEEWFKKTNGKTTKGNFESEYSYKQILDAREKIKAIDEIIKSKDYSQFRGYTPKANDFSLKTTISDKSNKTLYQQFSVETEAPMIDNWLLNSENYSKEIVEPKIISESFEGHKSYTINNGHYSGLLVEKNDNEAFITKTPKKRIVVLDDNNSSAEFLDKERE